MTTDAKRLDELAAVTREYATYATERAGLAGVVIGGWLVATFVIALRSETWGRIMALWAPLATVVALALSRRLYQRSGIVTPGADPRRKPFSGAWAWGVAVTMMSITANAFENSDRWTAGRGSLARFALLVAVSAAPVIPLAYVRIVGGPGQHRAVVYAAVTGAWAASLGNGRPGEPVWIMVLVMLGCLAIFGVILGGAGVAEHRQFARLERRLAALRSPTP